MEGDRDVGVDWLGSGRLPQPASITGASKIMMANERRDFMRHPGINSLSSVPYRCKRHVRSGLAWQVVAMTR